MKILKAAVFIASLLLILWLLLSIAEVNAKNHTENPQYCEYNVFELMIKEE